MIGKIAGGEIFEMELFDPLNGARLTDQYTLRHLPWANQVIDGHSKEHKAFVRLDLEHGWMTPPGYPPGINRRFLPDT